MINICQVCTTEEQEVAFDTVKNLFGHQKSGHRIFLGLIKPKQDAPAKTTPSATEKPASQTAPVVQTKPIVLKYKFEGECQKCNKEVETIEVKGVEINAMVAYCSNCKSQFTQVNVIPLEKQFKQELKPVIKSSKEKN